MSTAEKEPFESQAAAERAAWDAYQAQLDVLAAEELAQRQAAEFAEPADRSARGARADAAEEQAAHEEARLERAATREAALQERRAHDPVWRAAQAKRAAVKAHRVAVKAEREGVLDEQLELIRAQHKRAAQRRMAYLLQQSDLFKHFLAAQGEDGTEHGGGSTAQSAGKGTSRRSHSARDSEDDEAAAAESEGEEAPPQQQQQQQQGSASTPPRSSKKGSKVFSPGVRAHTRLTQQPSVIKFGTMRDYQVEGLNWMISLQENGLNGILADEMGLGKTLQSISVLGYMLEYKQVQGPHLVLVPKSTLSNWLAEFKRWCPQLRAVKFHGDKAERKEMTDGILKPGQREEERAWDVVVTTFEVAIREQGTLGRWPWRMLIIDEAHRCKNENSALAKAVRGFVVQHRLLLTGTPLQNNLHELWALLNLLLPDVFGDSDAFDTWFNVAVSGSDDSAKSTMVKQLHAVLKPFMLRRLKADVAKSLPPKTETFLYVGMSAVQRRIYRSVLKRDFQAVLSAGEESSAPAAAREEGAAPSGGAKRLLNIVMQLRKACAHPYLFDGVEDRSLPVLGEHLVVNCAKLNVLDKLLARMRANGSRVLIFSQMTRMLDILEDYCRMRSYGYCRIDGNTSYEDRESGINTFNAPGSDKFVYLLSTRAGGLGINLATADVVVLYDSDWNPQVDLQAQDRAHRIGQTKPVKVYRMITADTVEEKIVERAMIKLKLDAVVVQQGRLADKASRLSRDEMVRMIQYGADNVFRADGDGDGGMTDADIDAILSDGAARTAELAKKAEALGSAKAAGDGGASLLDFKLDTAVTSSVFEGVDYKKEKAQVAADRARLADLAALAAAEEEEARLERRTRVKSYSEASYFKSTTAAALRQGSTDPVKRLHTAMRRLAKAAPRVGKAWLPALSPWHFIDQGSAMALAEAEAAHMQAYVQGMAAHKDGMKAVSKGSATDAPLEPPLVPFKEAHPELAAQRDVLLAAGFPSWRRQDFAEFLKACRAHGRSAVDTIDDCVPGRRPVEVRRFFNTFWFGQNTADVIVAHTGEGGAAAPVAGLGALKVDSQAGDAGTVYGSYSSGKVHCLDEGARIVASQERAEAKLEEAIAMQRSLAASIARTRPPLPGMPLIESGLVPHKHLTEKAVCWSDLLPRKAAAAAQEARALGSVGGRWAAGAGDPWQHLPFRYYGRTSDEFTREHDRFMLNTVAKVGHGNWGAVRRAVLRSPLWRFDHFMRSRAPWQLRSRCETLMRVSDRTLPTLLAELKGDDERLAAAVQAAGGAGADGADAEEIAMAHCAACAVDKLKAAKRKAISSKAADKAAREACEFGGEMQLLLKELVPDSLLTYKALQAVLKTLPKLPAGDLDSAVADLAKRNDRATTTKANNDRPVTPQAAKAVLQAVAECPADSKTWQLQQKWAWLADAQLYMFAAVARNVHKSAAVVQAAVHAATRQADKTRAATLARLGSATSDVGLWKPGTAPAAVPAAGKAASKQPPAAGPKAPLASLAAVGQTLHGNKGTKRARESSSAASEGHAPSTKIAKPAQAKVPTAAKGSKPATGGTLDAFFKVPKKSA